jgi:hypothetical protein
MKGIVFTEFMNLVDEKFSSETTENLIEMSDLASGGVYTSVGTYPPGEMVTLVSNLSTVTGAPVADLLNAFGKHMFLQFFEKFPDFFEGMHSSFEFLPMVDSYVHLEVKKLYPDAELPKFVCTTPEPGYLQMIYASERNLPDMANGLIDACIDHFGDRVKVTRSVDPQYPMQTIFTIQKTDQ